MELKLPILSVEIVTPQFLLRGDFQPRGDLFIYLNDPRFFSFHFSDAKMMPLPTDFRIGTIIQEGININWHMITYIALRDEADIERLQFLKSKRHVTFYTDTSVIRGQLHVNPDSHEDDLLDETRNFLPVTQAAIYPLRPLATMPMQQAPLLALNRHHILGYHIYQPKDAA